jgi:hypothetical protein
MGPFLRKENVMDGLAFRKGTEMPWKEDIGNPSRELIEQWAQERLSARLGSEERHKIDQAWKLAYGAGGIAIGVLIRHWIPLI